jgi:hypothetical protein
MITELSIAGRSRAAVAIPAPDPTARQPTVLAPGRGGFGIGTTEFVSIGLLPETDSSLHVGEPATRYAMSGYAVGAPVMAALSVRVARKTLLTDVVAACALLAATALVVLIGSVLMRRRVRRATRTQTHTAGTLPVRARATEVGWNSVCLAQRCAHTN